MTRCLISGDKLSCPLLFGHALSPICTLQPRYIIRQDRMLVGEALQKPEVRVWLEKKLEMFRVYSEKQKHVG
ncbi:hypothetical protein FY534_11710 [Alicyclobacillus sp. TC]|nr:hypothetical protein FY534_11710 [Alicyclobacillus sp. TC]